MDSQATQELIADDRRYLWHPFTPMKPWCEDKEIVVIERAENEFLIDTNGKRYLDAVSSLWCNVHGHNVAELNQAITEQLGKVAHSTLLGLANVPSIQLAKRLVHLAQGSGLDLARCFFSDNGSTAVEVACKMAFQYWKIRGAERPRFLAFRNAYHGDTLGAVSVGGIPLFHGAFGGLTFAVDFVPPPNEDPDFAALQALLQQNRGAYAAIIIEPLVLGAAGMLMYPASALARIRQLATAHDTLLIADEVMTGFGRTGRMFACEHAGITPDLLCLSKNLTAGYLPLGATLASQRIFDAFYVDPNANDGANITKTFFHGHTFTGNPLGCAVALASLDLFEKNRTLEHVNALTPILDDFLAQARRDPHVHNPRRIGFIAACDLVHPQTRQPFPYHWRIGAALCSRMRTLGVIARPIADTLILMPPLAIKKENLQRLTAAYLQSLTWIPELLTAKGGG
jgi:adenosylmethionine-8-amino-7-oxononanoate transaminase